MTQCDELASSQDEGHRHKAQTEVVPGIRTG